MSFKTGSDFDEIKKSLGLPKYTIGFELRAYVNEIATIKCEYYLSLEPDEEDNLKRVISEYELHKKD